jgi:hypothetical protein
MILNGYSRVVSTVRSVVVFISLLNINNAEIDWALEILHPGAGEIVGTPLQLSAHADLTLAPEALRNHVRRQPPGSWKFCFHVDGASIGAWCELIIDVSFSS